jgi:zinc transporter 1/2/3
VSNTNGFDSDLGLRVGALFVILIGSTLGALFPVLASSRAHALPRWCFE